MIENRKIFIFCDEKGREAKLMIEDWEIGMLYWNCLAQSGGNEQEAVSKVKEKYFDSFIIVLGLY